MFSQNVFWLERKNGDIFESSSQSSRRDPHCFCPLLGLPLKLFFYIAAVSLVLMGIKLSSHFKHPYMFGLSSFARITIPLMIFADFLQRYFLYSKVNFQSCARLLKKQRVFYPIFSPLRLNQQFQCGHSENKLVVVLVNNLILYFI